jgi:hypothetical protein
MPKKQNPRKPPDADKPDDGAVVPLCAECGSDNVRADATAGWDTEEQDWSLAGVQDNCTCEACGASGKPWFVPMADERALRAEIEAKAKAKARARSGRA